MTKLMWQSRYWQRQLGWPGVAGLGLIAFCLGFYLSVINPEQAQRDSLRGMTVSLQERLKHTTEAMTREPLGPEEKLVAFYEFFPPADTAPDWLNHMYDAAKSHTLALQRGEYRLAQDQTGRLSTYRITLPVRGPYVQLRKFLATVLANAPFISLDEVGFEKQKIGEPAVETTINMTMYLRKTS